MLKRLIFTAFLGLSGVLFMMVLGCSSGTSPVAPDDTGMSIIPEARNNTGGCMLWGLWNVAIDVNSGMVDITDIRTADDCLNVLGFLEPPALANMGISNLIISAPTQVQVDVSLTHPFTTSSHVFHGFDVKGVVFGANLVNRDGTTAWMNPNDFSGVPFGYQDGLLGVPHSSGHYTGTNWGYKYFADGLTKNQDLVAFFSNSTNLNKRGIFTEGTTNTRHYDMTFTPSSSFLVFNYAVVANYDWPTGSPPYNANSFSIATANCQEAFCVAAYEVSNNLWYDPTAGVGGGTLDIDVEVYDWQGLGNTTVSLTGGGLTPVNVSTSSPGSTAHSGIFSFTGLAPTVGSSAAKIITVTATDSSATFGSSWFSGMLPASNSKYSANVYTTITAQFNVATAGNYYTNTSVSDYVLYTYPHQAQGCKWDFVDYYNFTQPPVFGRHDICVHSGPGSVIGPSVQVIDTAGVSPFGPPPPGGGWVLHIPIPLGSAPVIPGIEPGVPTPPYLTPPWLPTRFDGVSTYETQYCDASTSFYFMLPPMPEYAVIQQMHALPGGALVPLSPDVATFMFPGGGPWDIGVDVSNGFSQGNQAGALYGLFFHDYTTWMNTGMPVGPFVPPAGAWIFKQATPIAGPPLAFPVVTSFGFPAPGPGVIDDSSQWGVCGSLAVDSAPVNQQGLTLQFPELFYVLDTEGDIEILEIDFLANAVNPYGYISTAHMGAGNMAADIEMIDTSKIAANNPKGYVPGTNLLAVAMVDNSGSSSQGKWWIDIYIINKGNNTSTLHASTPLNSGQPFLAMDIDEMTGEIYVLHGSNSTPGKTAITVYKYI